jgi:hypothetical protein
MLINKLANLNRSHRNATSASLVLIAAVAMYNWIAEPHLNYLMAAQQYESVMSDMARNNEALRNTVESKKKRLKKLHEESASLRSTFFTDAKAREFFSDLEVICEQSGCTVNSINFVRRGEGHKSKKFEDLVGAAAQSAILSVVGGYDNVVRLFEKLQARTEKVWIDSVNMQTLDYRSAYPRCDMTITIYTIQTKESTDE